MKTGNVQPARLRLMLRIFGSVMLTGAPLAFIPNSLMLSIGRAFGLPPFDLTPVVEYMARTEAFGAALFGALLWWLSGRLDRHRAVVRFLGVLMVSAFPVVLWIHLKIDTPWFWKAGDLAGSGLGGALLVWMAGRAGAGLEAV